jgi:hypothetical protein
MLPNFVKSERVALPDMLPGDGGGDGGMEVGLGGEGGS